MNNSKKAIKRPTVGKKKQKPANTRVLIIIGAVLAVLLVGTLLFDQLYKRAIVTIDGEKYNLQDMSYYIYGIESQYDYYDQMFGGMYWDMTYDETTGATNRDMAKQQAMQTTIYNEVLYREAVAKGYSLTEEEKTAAATNASDLLSGGQLSATMINHNGFTKKFLANIMGKITLVSRYRKDVVDTLNIDDAALTAGVDKAANRQYDIEYLFIPTQTTDADGKKVDLSEADKTAAFDKISAVYDTALTTADWSTLIPSDEQDLTYQKDNFLESGTTFSEDFEKMMMAMDNNSISEVYKAENGYYIVRMLNNNSSESYDAAVKKAITDAEDKAFETVYTDLLANHKFTINTKAWDKLTMGSITLVK